MPSPANSDAADLRPDLGLAVQEYDVVAEQNGYIASRVLPVFESALQSSGFGRIPIKALLQNPEVSRAPGAPYNRGDWEFEPDSFATKEYGWEEPVDDRTSKIYARYFDAELVAGNRARGIVLRAAEIRAANLLFNASSFTAHAVTNEWDDTANATPIDDVEAAVRRVWAASGLWPNALVINRLVFRNLRNCDQIIDRINSAGAGNRTLAKDITAQMLATALDLDQVVVAGAPKNTANEDKPVVIAPIWSSEYAMVARIAQTADLEEPCIGRTIHWGEDGSQIGGFFETYYSRERRSNVVRSRHDVDEKLLHTVAADLMSNITT
jgi:hypothetical protein